MTPAEGVGIRGRGGGGASCQVSRDRYQTNGKANDPFINLLLSLWQRHSLRNPSIFRFENRPTRMEESGSNPSAGICYRGVSVGKVGPGVEEISRRIDPNNRP